MRESRTYGFVRGVPGNWHPYRDSQQFCGELSLPVIERQIAAGLEQPPNLAAVGTDLPVSRAGLLRNALQIGRLPAQDGRTSPFRLFDVPVSSRVEGLCYE